MAVKTEKMNGAKRASQKERTRRAIIDAALELSAKQGFSSLSLREVTREVGISPNAFYSHFHDLEDLRLHIIDEGGVALRRVMRQVRQKRNKGNSVIRLSLETFVTYLESNGNLFRLMIATRSEGPLQARRAVYKEIQRFFGDLVEDIERDAQLKGRPTKHADQVAHAVTTIVFNGCMELLDLPDVDREKLVESLIMQVRLVTLGAEALARGWRPDTRKRQSERFRQSAVENSLEESNV